MDAPCMAMCGTSARWAVRPARQGSRVPPLMCPGTGWARTGRPGPHTASARPYGPGRGTGSARPHGTRRASGSARRRGPGPGTGRSRPVSRRRCWSPACPGSGPPRTPPPPTPACSGTRCWPPEGWRSPGAAAPRAPSWPSPGCAPWATRRSASTCPSSPTCSPSTRPYGPDTAPLAVRIDDDGGATPATAPEPGVGLLGMRERVTALGGRLRAEPRDEGGFTVHAELPVDGVA